MRLIFCGSGEFGLPTLRALREAGHTIVQVLTQPDRPAGRGRKLTPTPIGHAADAMGLQAQRTVNINEQLLEQADLMIVIAFGQKIADRVVNKPRLGSINLHASRLPRYRGAAPINWAILRGETVTGNSVIRLASKMDAGAVLGMSRLDIGNLETAGELHDRLAIDGAPLVLRVISQLSDGTAIEIAQDESAATLAPKLSRQAAHLDFSQPADLLCRQVRGLYPWPGCRVELLDAGGQSLARLRLVRAAMVVGGNTSPGTINPDESVQTGEGAMQIIEVQPEGKNAMPLGDYARGNRWEPGLRVRSTIQD